jgi:hypothetical protein
MPPLSKTNCIIRILSTNEEKCKAFLEFARSFTELDRLCGLLESYLKNSSFKIQTDQLINQIKECIENINIEFKSDESVDHQLRMNAGILTNPVKFCEAVKRSFEHITLALIKVTRLLDLFSSKQKILSKDEKNELIKKVKYTIPFIVEQMKIFLNSIFKQSLHLSEGQKRDLADSILPKVDNIVTLFIEMNQSSQEIIEKMVTIKYYSENNKENLPNHEESDQDPDVHDDDDYEADYVNHFFDSTGITNQNNSIISSPKSKFKNLLAKSIRNTIHLKELKKLQQLGEKIRKNFQILEKKLLKYKNCNDETRANIIHKEVDEFIDNMKVEIPKFIRKLDKYSVDKVVKSSRTFKLNDFKFTFKLIASKTCWSLNQMRSNKRLVGPLIDDLFNKLDNHKLKNEFNLLNITPPHQSSMTKNNKLIDSNNQILTRLNDVNNVNKELPCHLDSFYKSRSAYHNRLAQRALELYETKQFSDIQLEIHNVSNEDEVKFIPVHGSIIVARCTWFHRALSSGMKESIHKKVILHDTNLVSFEVFIKYLYIGSLEENDNSNNINSINNYSIDEIIELLTLADKYEVKLIFKNFLKFKKIILIFLC